MPEQFGVVHFTAHAAANAESPLDSAVILSKDGWVQALRARRRRAAAVGRSRHDLRVPQRGRADLRRRRSGRLCVGVSSRRRAARDRRTLGRGRSIDGRSDGTRVRRDRQGRTPGAALRHAKLAMIAAVGRGQAVLLGALPVVHRLRSCLEHCALLALSIAELR